DRNVTGVQTCALPISVVVGVDVAVVGDAVGVSVDRVVHQAVVTDPGRGHARPVIDGRRSTCGGLRVAAGRAHAGVRTGPGDVSEIGRASWRARVGIEG